MKNAKDKETPAAVDALLIELTADMMERLHPAVK
jgi:hypothetical protein